MHSGGTSYFTVRRLTYQFVLSLSSTIWQSAYSLLSDKLVATSSITLKNDSRFSMRKKSGKRPRLQDKQNESRRRISAAKFVISSDSY